jgi:hypothetical protein
MSGVRLLHPTLAHDGEILRLHDSGEGEQASRLAGRTPWPPLRADWTARTAECVRAVAAAQCGTDAIRRASYDALAPWAGTIAITGTFDCGPVDYYLGLLAASLDDAQQAGFHFAAVEDRAARAGLTWWAGRARSGRAALAAMGTAPARPPARGRTSGR